MDLKRPISAFIGTISRIVHAFVDRPFPLLGLTVANRKMGGRVAGYRERKSQGIATLDPILEHEITLVFQTGQSIHFCQSNACENKQE